MMDCRGSMRCGQRRGDCNRGRRKLERSNGRQLCNRASRGSLRRWKKPGTTEAFMLGTILIIVLVLLLIGALPRWGHSASWGYGPSGILGLILVVIVILLLLGRL